MSKRRNPKKEKAQRNKAYARKFSKHQNTGRFSKNWRGKARNNQNPNDAQDDGMGQDERREF